MRAIGIRSNDIQSGSFSLAPFDAYYIHEREMPVDFQTLNLDGEMLIFSSAPVTMDGSGAARNLNAIITGAVMHTDYRRVRYVGVGVVHDTRSESVAALY
jgi:hypothetical protein